MQAYCSTCISILLYDNRLKMGKLTFYKKTLAFCKIPWYYLTCVSGCGSAWLERRLREAEVASSNPATPIHCKVLDFQGLFLCYVSCCNPVFTFCNASGIAPLHGKTCHECSFTYCKNSGVFDQYFTPQFSKFHSSM